ncbi:hypothetical protein, partial [Methanothermobacter sp.]
MAASGVFGSLFLVVMLVTLVLRDQPLFRRPVICYCLLVVAVNLHFNYVFSGNRDILAVFNPSGTIPGLGTFWPCSTLQ